MTRRLALAAAFFYGLSAASPATGDPLMTEDFSDGASSRWSFFTDQVMGACRSGRQRLRPRVGRPSCAFRAG